MTKKVAGPGFLLKLRVMRKWSYGHFNSVLGLKNEKPLYVILNKGPRERREMRMNEVKGDLNTVLGEKQR